MATNEVDQGRDIEETKSTERQAPRVSQSPEPSKDTTLRDPHSDRKRAAFGL